MDKSTSILEFGLESTKDALTEVLRSGTQQLLLAAVEEKLENFLRDYSSVRLSDGRLAVVCNGHLPARTIQSGIGRESATLTLRFLRACLPSHSNIRYMYNEVKFMYIGDFYENSIPKRYNP